MGQPTDRRQSPLAPRTQFGQPGQSAAIWRGQLPAAVGTIAQKKRKGGIAAALLPKSLPTSECRLPGRLPVRRPEREFFVPSCRTNGCYHFRIPLCDAVDLGSIILFLLSNHFGLGGSHDFTLL